MGNRMIPAYVVGIVTPQKYLLNGLWFGPLKPRRVIIFVHGLGGSIFSMLRLVDVLVDSKTAVIAFNNRGHEIISKLRRRKKRLIGGAAHEVFVDCVDDILGAVNLARKSSAKDIFLAGHSTGCQKSVYYAHRMQHRARVKGLILLAPISDYSAALKDDKKGRLAKATKRAQLLVRSGRRHDLLPAGSHRWPIDAQRFLSLYTPGSVEEIFLYAQPKKNPKILKNIRTPTLVILAGADEHCDRPASEIATWFQKHIHKGKVVIIPRVKHSFRGGEKSVARAIRRFISE